MHVAAMSPQYLDRRRRAGRSGRRGCAQSSAQPCPPGKPPEVADKIVEGKLNKWYEEHVLLDQPFVKDDAMSVGDLINRPSARSAKRFACGASPNTRSVSSSVRGRPRFSRVLLKISGEALRGPTAAASTSDTTRAMAEQIAEVSRGRRLDRGRRRRRQHLARQGSRRGRAWTAPPPTTWACSRRSSTRWRCRTRSSASACLARADGDRDAPDRRAVHPPPRDPPSREGPRRHLRRRNRQSVLHDRYDGRAARRRGRTPKRFSRRRRSTASTRRSEERPDGNAFRSSRVSWTCCSAAWK